MSVLEKYSLQNLRRPETPNYLKLQAGQAVGQVLSYVTAPIGLVMTKKFAPRVLDRISSLLKFYLIIPHIKRMEPLVGAILIDDEEKQLWKELKKRPVSERAEFISSNMSKYVMGAGISVGTSLGAKFASDKVLRAESGWGVILKSSGVDTGVRLGAIAVMSTLLSTPANKTKNNISSWLQKKGMSKENADDAALASLFVGIPDTVGFLAGNRYLRTNDPSVKKGR